MSRADTVGTTEKPGFFLEIPRLDLLDVDALHLTCPLGGPGFFKLAWFLFFMQILDQSFLGFFFACLLSCFFYLVQFCIHRS